jgi:methylated-DNA-[protein]-cysteine S-methyltransferase
MCDWKWRKNRASINTRIQTGLDAHFEEEISQVILKAISQLEAYFSGERREFALPLLMIGSEFQQRVWKELLKIPYGETETYLSLTNRIGNMNTIRAVAAANGANAISIMVPCHRIIGSDGNLVGYAGGLDAKKKLLQLENKDKFPEQLELFE